MIFSDFQLQIDRGIMVLDKLFFYKLPFQIKIWRIPESGLTSDGLSEPELVLASQPRRIETVDFHPTADNILATSSANFLVLWDLVQAQEIFSFAVSLK